MSSINRENLQIADYKSYQGNEAPSRAKKLIKNRDVIFATVRPTLKRLTLIAEDFDGEICSTAFCILRTNGNILSPIFLLYAVQRDTFIEELGKIQRGASYPAVTDSDVKNQKIPLPPLPEQHAIAKVLYAAQQAKEKTDAVISATKELKKSMMKHLFSYGPVPVKKFNELGEFDEFNEFNEFNELRVNELGVNELQNVQNSKNSINLKETEIGLVPEEWDIAKLGKKGHFQYGYTTSATEEDTGTKFLRITDINEDGFVNWGTVPYGYIEDENIQKFKLSEGDILFARIGATTGKTCIIGGATPHAIFASYLIRFVSNEELYSKYVFYFTQTRKYQKLVNSGKEGKLKKGLSATELKNFKIPLPPITTQQKIASILSAVDKKIETEEAKRKSLDELFKSLLHNLMTGKLRVTEL